ncbi:hypothetical protein DVA76_19250, partial [Acinetobacter baumannii]
TCVLVQQKIKSVALSIVEAKYIAVGSYCSQILWMKQQLEDYGIHGIHLGRILIQCDNTSTINITKNLMQHSHTKYIDIRHHFI